jgi:hypothetical protein
MKNFFRAIRHNIFGGTQVFERDNINTVERIDNSNDTLGIVKLWMKKPLQRIWEILTQQN